MLVRDMKVNLESRELYQGRSGVRPRASSFVCYRETGPQYAIQQLQKVAPGEGLTVTRKSLEEQIGRAHV